MRLTAAGGDLSLRRQRGELPHPPGARPSARLVHRVVQALVGPRRYLHVFSTSILLCRESSMIPLPQPVFLGGRAFLQASRLARPLSPARSGSDPEVPIVGLMDERPAGRRFRYLVSPAFGPRRRDRISTFGDSMQYFTQPCPLCTKEPLARSSALALSSPTCDSGFASSFRAWGGRRREVGAHERLAQVHVRQGVEELVVVLRTSASWFLP